MLVPTCCILKSTSFPRVIKCVRKCVREGSSLAKNWTQNCLPAPSNCRNTCRCVTHVGDPAPLDHECLEAASWCSRSGMLWRAV